MCQALFWALGRLQRLQQTAAPAFLSLLPCVCVATGDSQCVRSSNSRKGTVLPQVALQSVSLSGCCPADSRELSY